MFNSVQFASTYSPHAQQPYSLLWYKEHQVYQNNGEVHGAKGGFEVNGYVSRIWCLFKLHDDF